VKTVALIISAAACVVAAQVPAASGAAVDVRFCPPGQVRVYPAESQRGVQSLVLQNALVTNSGSSPLEIIEVEIGLLQGDRPVDVRRLAGADLQRIAATGPRLQSSGMLQLASFQFCGKALVPDGVVLAGPVLQAKQAMLITYQPFLYRGQRDALRLTVRARSGDAGTEVSAQVPIRSDTARTRLVLPLTGTWFAAVGPTLHTAHRWGLPEEFGFDFVQLGEGTSTHRGSGARFADYYAYGATVRAAAAGRVLAAVADIPEDPAVLRNPTDTAESYGQRVQQLQTELLRRGGAAGNYVLIDHGNSEYSLYAHLQPASVSVKPGDDVKGGQSIGRLGSSGNSTEPHLHFQLCDRPEPLDCAGIPIAFDGISLPYADYPRPLQSGDIVFSR